MRVLLYCLNLRYAVPVALLKGGHQHEDASKAFEPMRAHDDLQGIPLNLSCFLQGAFGAPQAAAQQQQVPYGANLGYAHPSQYNNYAPYAMNSGYGSGFQQPAANYSGYGVSRPSMWNFYCCHGTWLRPDSAEC